MTLSKTLAPALIALSLVACGAAEPTDAPAAPVAEAAPADAAAVPEEDASQTEAVYGDEAPVAIAADPAEAGDDHAHNADGSHPEGDGHAHDAEDDGHAHDGEDADHAH